MNPLRIAVFVVAVGVPAALVGAVLSGAMDATTGRDRLRRLVAPAARDATRPPPRWVRITTAARERRAGAAACLELCQGLAAELHAGRSPIEALEHAAVELPTVVRDRLARVIARAHAGGDVSAELIEVSRRPGLGGLARLAACWRVGSEAGSGFAAVLDRLADTLRAEAEHRGEVAAQLAGARASARMLAALPVLGLLLAAGLGTDPLRFLCTTPYGLACLACGLVLDAAGLVWTHRLATHAEEDAPC